MITMNDQAELLKVAVEIQQHYSRRNTPEEFRQQIASLNSEAIEDVSGYETEDVETIKTLVLTIAEHIDDLKVVFSSIYHGDRGEFDKEDMIQIVKEVYAIGYSGATLFVYEDIDEQFIAAVSGELLSKLMFANEETKKDKP